MTEVKYVSEVIITKDTTYLALTGELWCVFCEDLGENWPRYKRTALYFASYREFISTPTLPAIWPIPSIAVTLEWKCHFEDVFVALCTDNCFFRGWGWVSIRWYSYWVRLLNVQYVHWATKQSGPRFNINTGVPVARTHIIKIRR